MSIPKYELTFKNSLNEVVGWRVEIWDTQSDPIQTLQFRCEKGSVDLGLDGAVEDLLPGVYPTTFRVSMMVTTVLEGFINNILESDEKRWVVKAYREDVQAFVGFLIPDNSNWEDAYYPYKLSLFAVAGFHILEATTYARFVGKPQYAQCTNYDYEGTSAFTVTPLSACLVGAGWILQLHESWVATNDPYYHEDPPHVYQSGASSIYVREVIESIDEPPGAGWIAEGTNRWVRSPIMISETILDESAEDPPYYKISRIFTQPADYEVINDMLLRAFDLVGLGEYVDDYYYDVLMTHYNQDMKDTTGDRSKYIQIPIGKYLKGTTSWMTVLNDLCKSWGLRIYQSGGQFKVEEVVARTLPSYTRFQYDKDGELVDTSTEGDESINPIGHIATGGNWTAQAALRELNVTLKLDQSNYLLGEYWQSGVEGERYVGVFANTSEVEHLYFLFKNRSISTFSQEVLNMYPPNLWKDLTQHRVRFSIRVRAVNRITGETFYLKPGTQVLITDIVGTANLINILSSQYLGSWQTVDAHANVFDLNIQNLFVGGAGQFFENPVIRTKYINFRAPAPGSEGQTFDLYVAWMFDASFVPNPNGQPALNHVWGTEHPDEYTIFGQTFDDELHVTGTDGSLLTRSIDRIINVRNTVNNSKTVTTPVDYFDSQFHKQGIRILNPDDKWINSYEKWGHDTVTPTELSFMEMLAKDYMSLRMLPRKIFNGGFYSEVFCTHWLFQRGAYYYLPVRVSGNLDEDLYSGDFIQIAAGTPPDGTVIDNPTLADLHDIPVIVTSEPLPSSPILFFVTAEDIAALAVLTSVAIVNTQGQEVPTGNTVSIMKLSTGQQENVILTADVLPDSTVMEFITHTFVRAYPSESPIMEQADVLVDAYSSLPIYRFHNPAYVSTYHYTTQYNFPNPDTNSATIINKKVEIYRKGLLMKYVATGDPDILNSQEYLIDWIGKKFVWGTDFPFTGEQIDIRAY